MLTSFATMLEYAFVQSAFVAAAIVAVVSGLVGYFLVLRGQTFAGHALGHIGFTGATGAVLVGMTPLGGLVILTVAAGVGMGLLEDRIMYRDVAIGIVLAFALGLGLLFLHFYVSSATQATSILFGNVFAVGWSTVWVLLGIGLATVGALALISRPLLFASLQPEVAEARGVSLRLYAVLFLALVALATAESAQIVGVLLVFALMVGPAAAAQRLTVDIRWGLTLSVTLALGVAWFGIVAAYWSNWPASFWISALSASVYVLATLANSLRAPVTA